MNAATDPVQLEFEFPLDPVQLAKLDEPRARPLVSRTPTRPRPDRGGRGSNSCCDRRAVRAGCLMPRRNRNAMRSRRAKKPRKHRGRPKPGPLARWSLHSAPRGLGR